MKSYHDFSEPMQKNETRRKIEYQDEVERYATTSNHVRLPYASEVLSKSKRQPRGEEPSKLLVDHMQRIANGALKSNDLQVYESTPRVISETARVARNEIFSKLGRIK